MQKTCFVIMAIGDQEFNGVKVSRETLKSKYDDLIKEAIFRCRPDLEIVRADEVAVPGTMTTDIITRIMHSDYVIADVTYPNPNVFYELGLRHACKPGTIILKEKNGPSVPFDIAHLRYVDYENTTAGLKDLSGKLAQYFEHFDRNPLKPDNHLLELAKLTGYQFQDYSKDEEPPLEVQAIMAVMNSSALLDLFAKQQSGENVDQLDIIRAFAQAPQAVQPILTALSRSGNLNIFGDSKPKIIGEK